MICQWHRLFILLTLPLFCTAICSAPVTAASAALQPQNMELLVSDTRPFPPPPTVLLLPRNESITLPLQLPPVLPPIQGPKTPRTLRRILIKEHLGTPHTPIRRTAKKKGKSETTRDNRLRVQT